MSNGSAPAYAPAPTFMDLAWPARGDAAAAAVRGAILALLGTALLIVSAKIQVPFWPVPMTLQSMVVLLIGAAYGWRLGAATLMLYLAEGAIGLPVFAGTSERGIGLAYMMGPTGGFLIGFALAAAATGYLAERGWDRSLPRVVAMMVLGHIVLFLPGLAWLASIMGWEQAWAVGVAPFVAGTVVKTALAVALAQAGWTFLRRARG
jgi:biotin transport system substrate-specific component